MIWEKTISVAIYLCLIQSWGFAQRIVHQTLATTAVPATSVNATLFYVIGGSCVGCSALQGDLTGTTIYPGFPTPGADTCFSMGVVVEETQDDCGTYYQFYYTGNAASGQVQFEWHFGTGAYPQIAYLPEVSDVAFDDTGAKDILLRVSDGSGCEKEYAFTIEVMGTGFAANPLVTHVDCFGEATGSIELELLNGTMPFDFQWDNGGQTILLENLPAGQYAFTVTDAQGCSYDNIALVQQPDSPIELNIIPTDETCISTTDGMLFAQATGGTPPYRFEWNTGDTTQQLTQIPSGEYFLTVTDARGCTTARSVFLGQACNPRAMDVITPNGDGINDVWVVDNLENFPDNEVRIYNRWGELVYSTKGYTNDWGGMGNKGKMLPAGAYYYVLRINGDTFGLPPIRTGAINLIR